MTRISPSNQQHEYLAAAGVFGAPVLRAPAPPPEPIANRQQQPRHIVACRTGCSSSAPLQPPSRWLVFIAILLLLLAAIASHGGEAKTTSTGMPPTQSPIIAPASATGTATASNKLTVGMLPVDNTEFDNFVLDERQNALELMVSSLSAGVWGLSQHM